MKNKRGMMKKRKKLKALGMVLFTLLTLAACSGESKTLQKSDSTDKIAKSKEIETSKSIEESKKIETSKSIEVSK
ncbi:MAG: hypothetical protein WAX43_06495, partial [Lactococcus chungangensis]